jgi:tetratricopeptide (TPR) repeat protein
MIVSPRRPKAAVVVMLFASTVLVSCENAHRGERMQTTSATSVTVPDTWLQHGIRLLGSNKCDELRSFLSTIPEREVNEEWFRLRALGEGMCWTHTRSAKDKASALQAVDEGISKYPESAGLIAAKGGLLELFGDRVAAQPLYDRARQVAEANLRKNPMSRKDRSLLRRLNGDTPVGSSQPTSTSIQEPGPPDDTVDIRPAWQRAAWQFMAADNCRGAVRYLDQHPLADPMWFTLRSQADLLCFQEHLGDAYKTDAFKTLEAGLSANPDSPRLLKTRGEAFAAIGDTTSAERCFQEAAVSARRKLSDTHSKEEADEVLQELAMSGHAK